MTATILAALLGSRARGAQESVQSPLVPLMQDFGRTFGALDRAAAAGDTRQASFHAAALIRTAASVSPPRALATSDRRAFEVRLRALQTAAESVRELPHSGARAAVDDVRRACTRCHVQFTDHTRSRYPEASNTIAGVVDIRQQGGAPRADRDGVAVFLEGGPAGSSEPAANASVSQSDRRFAPRVLPILRGDRVVFPNNDTVFHNVFSRSTAGSFDLGTYAAGERRSVEFSKTGLVKVYCNIHPDMVMYVLVLATRFVDVTDAGGHFAITGVPDGTFTLRTWHDRGGDLSQTVTVRGGVVQRLSLALTETRRSIEHLDKFGLPYKRKY